MKRHAHMLDLLRPGITLAGEIENLENKAELTREDLYIIFENATAVARAAEVVFNRKRH